MASKIAALICTAFLFPVAHADGHMAMYADLIASLASNETNDTTITVLAVAAGADPAAVAETLASGMTNQEIIAMIENDDGEDDYDYDSETPASNATEGRTNASSGNESSQGSGHGHGSGGTMSGPAGCYDMSTHTCDCTVVDEAGCTGHWVESGCASCATDSSDATATTSPTTAAPASAPATESAAFYSKGWSFVVVACVAVVLVVQ